VSWKMIAITMLTHEVMVLLGRHMICLVMGSDYAVSDG
jgi:hypothetical protein